MRDPRSLKRLTAAVALRDAAIAWAEGRRIPPRDQHDREFKRLDAKLQAAARRFVAQEKTAHD